MLNPLDANAELNLRLLDILMKAKLSGMFTYGEMRDLCFATGVQIQWSPRETRLERLQRMAREAEEWKKQHDQEAAQAALRG